MHYHIQLAQSHHVAALPAIEDAAGELFSHDDLPEPLRSNGIPVTDFAAAQSAGMLWVALAADDVPVGFLMAHPLDDALFIRELDVHPTVGKNGIGSALLAHVFDVARERGHSAVTLTTFRHVPWNAPFYERRGFKPLDDSEVSAALRRLLDFEHTQGLRNRVAMRASLARA